MTYIQKTHLKAIVESTLDPSGSPEPFWAYCECNPIDGNKPFRLQTLVSLLKKGFIEMCVCNNEGSNGDPSKIDPSRYLGTKDIPHLNPGAVYWCRPTARGKGRHFRPPITNPYHNQ